jgi:alpha-ketoglutarate-dependent taurine dioxygenase
VLQAGVAPDACFQLHSLNGDTQEEHVQITPQAGQLMGSMVAGFDIDTAKPADIDELRGAIYEHRILILKEQHLSAEQFIALGTAMGEIEVYYEPMYHHPEHQEIFVSGVQSGDQAAGVPQTGKFWHADYSFMAKPFGITMTYPQIVPATNRGTYFIDMAKFFAELDPTTQEMLRTALSVHSPRRYFKIRPSDVYRPIGELQAEIERITPPVIHPAVFKHPFTGEEVLYISEAGTCELREADGTKMPDSLLNQLLEASGQLDMSFTDRHIHLQRFVKGDLLIWDNRALIHRALHNTRPEPSLSYRITVNDAEPFYPGILG